MIKTPFDRWCKRKNTRGNSLIESLFAAILLTFGLVTMVYSLQTSYSLVRLSKYHAMSNRVAKSVIHTLKSHKDFEKLFDNYKIFDDQGVDHRFYIMENGSIDWSRPLSIPKGAIGEGFLSFVTNEHQYPASEWGTDTAFSTNGSIVPGQIDLDGDLDAEDKAIVIGRTLGTPLGQLDGYYVILPVKVTIRIYGGGGNGSDLSTERRGWITNNFDSGKKNSK